MALDSWKVALIQTTTGLDAEESARHLCDAVAEAASKGAQLISTPEMSNFLAARRKEAMERAKTETDDPVLKSLAAAAKAHSCWVHIGSLCLRGPGDMLVNRGFLIDPSGGIVARYDKIHMFDVDLGKGETYQESALYQPGREAVLAKTPFGGIGLTICYDIRFPALYRNLAEAGADILLVPAAFTQPTGEAHWETLLKARAIETGAYVLAAGQCGAHESGRKTHGHSMVIDPWGKPLATLDRTPGLLYCDIDMTKVDKARRRIPALKHSRAFTVSQVAQ